MEDSITRYPGALAQKELGKRLSPGDCAGFDDDSKMKEMAQYFRYYLVQCELFDNAQQELGRMGLNPLDLKIRSHADVARLVDLLYHNALDRERLHTAIEEHYEQLRPSNVPSHPMIDLWIDWIARLVTMMEIGHVPWSFTSSKPQLWCSGSLKDLVSSITIPDDALDPSVKLERPFNVVALERIAGIRVEWTDDLASHLSLRDDDKTLILFHHVAFLELAKTDIFPDGFLDETMRTLALLLPSQEREVRRWFGKQNLKSLDPGISSRRRLRSDERRIEKFYYWGERLSVLKEVFDEAQPGTLSQWWYDRRKGPQWYTFWVAIVVLALTIFFGLVQSVEGALQVWLAWKSGGSG